MYTKLWIFIGPLTIIVSDRGSARTPLSTDNYFSIRASNRGARAVVAAMPYESKATAQAAEALYGDHGGFHVGDKVFTTRHTRPRLSRIDLLFCTPFICFFATLTYVFSLA